MARLDAEAAAAVARPSRVPTAAQARAYLDSLPELWAKTSDAGRHAIAEAVFERIDVLGGERLHVHADGPREGPRMGCSLRGWGPINLDWSIWSGREDLNRRPPVPQNLPRRSMPSVRCYRRA